MKIKNYVTYLALVTSHRHSNGRTSGILSVSHMTPVVGPTPVVVLGAHDGSAQLIDHAAQSHLARMDPTSSSRHRSIRLPLRER